MTLNRVRGGVIGFIFVFMVTSSVGCQEEQSVRVEVITGDGGPVQGAQVDVRFLGTGTRDVETKSGVTDEFGCFEVSGSSVLRTIAFASKNGYYDVESGDLSRKVDHDIQLRLWEIKNPIPLYAKRLQVVAPVIEKRFAYDCEVGDWVEPHGLGKVPDLVCLVRSIRKNDRYSDYHHELLLAFSNSEDGFVRFTQRRYSELKSPYSAPVEGDYQRAWKYFRKREPGSGMETNANPSGGYFFRLRTVVDEKGKIVSCHYAKAYGDIPDLKIYFNPTPNDPNLEFDPKRNLFEGLDPLDQVRDP